MDHPHKKGTRLIKRRPVPSPEHNPPANPTPSQPSQPSIGVMPPTPSASTHKTDKEKRSRWRMSNPFHPKDKDKERDSTATTAVESEESRASHPTVSSTLNPDSAYGGSDPNSSFSGSTNNRVSFSTSSDNIRPLTQVPSLSNESSHDRLQVPTAQTTAQNAPSDPPVTQEVHQEGNTVVTTTTTTTTTTVTRVGPNGQTTVQVPRQETGSGEGQRNQTTVTTNAPVNAPPPQRKDSHSGSPPIPARSSMRDRAELDGMIPGAAVSAQEAPPVSPMTSTTPNRPNFSYPGRSPITSNDRLNMPSQYSQPQQDPAMPAPLQVGPQGQALHQKGSTLANLKTAAAGIHGAAETLRGTLNSSADRRFGADQETMAKNDRVIQTGKAEIETGHFHREPEGGRERLSKLDNIMHKAHRYGNDRLGSGAAQQNAQRT